MGPYTLTMSGTHQILIAGRVISTIAGTGGIGFSGDGGPATNATINGPYGLAYDSLGNLFFADNGNQRIRKVDTSGIITTIAGTGTAGYSGDGSKAVKAQLNNPTGLAVDSQGNVFVADLGNYRVRKITPAGLITTVAGNGLCCSYNGDGIPATSATIYPYDVAVDSQGNLLISDNGSKRIRKVGTNGIISTFAGGALCCSYDDGIPATSATLSSVDGIAVDSQGNVFLADGNRVRKIDTTGVISTVAGTTVPGFNYADYQPAIAANFYNPRGVVKDSQGNIYIAVLDPYWVRRDDANGIVATAAGTSNPSSDQQYNGDGIPGLMAKVKSPPRVTVNSQGDLIISDLQHYRIRKVDKTLPGNITLTLTIP
jgi:hypothetical protein